MHIRGRKLARCVVPTTTAPSNTMLVRSFLATVALTATALAAPIAAPDASPAIAAREPSESWYFTSPDASHDSDGDGVPEYDPNWKRDS